jgi:hypothetical protein
MLILAFVGLLSSNVKCNNHTQGMQARASARTYETLCLPSYTYVNFLSADSAVFNLENQSRVNYYIRPETCQYKLAL